MDLIEGKYYIFKADFVNKIGRFVRKIVPATRQYRFEFVGGFYVDFSEAYLQRTIREANELESLLYGF